MKEFLEKEWTEGLGEEAALKLTVKALLEVLLHSLKSPCPKYYSAVNFISSQVVDSGSKNMEVVVVRQGVPMVALTEDKLQALTDEIIAEIEAAKAAGAAGREEMKDS